MGTSDHDLLIKINADVEFIKENIIKENLSPRLTALENRSDTFVTKGFLGAVLTFVIMIFGAAGEVYHSFKNY